jgi:hypothetical protein
MHAVNQLTTLGRFVRIGCNALARLYITTSPRKPVRQSFTALPETGGLCLLDKCAVNHVELQSAFLYRARHQFAMASERTTTTFVPLYPRVSKSAF